jgi:hypothetical protein
LELFDHPQQIFGVVDYFLLALEVVDHLLKVKLEQVLGIASIGIGWLTTHFDFNFFLPFLFLIIFIFNDVIHSEHFDMKCKPDKF